MIAQFKFILIVMVLVMVLSHLFEGMGEQRKSEP